LAVIDKPISKLKDDEEETLFYNLETRLQELESLVELSEQEVDESKDEAFQLELVPFGRNPIKENIKVSKKTLVDHEENLKHIRQQLTGNKKKDLAILFKLIEDIASK